MDPSCPECGQPVAAFARRCLSCGAALSQGEDLFAEGEVPRIPEVPPVPPPRPARSPARRPSVSPPLVSSRGRAAARSSMLLSTAAPWLAVAAFAVLAGGGVFVSDRRSARTDAAAASSAPADASAPPADFLAGVPEPTGAPRAISEAEREGVIVAADFLSRGPAAISSRLAEDSPFRRYPGAALAAEIEVRTGPSTGARWTLSTTSAELAADSALFDVEQPSGVRDGVLLRFDPATWRLREARSLSERAAATDPPKRPADRPAEAGPGARGFLRIGLAAFAALAAGAAAVLLLQPRKPWTVQDRRGRVAIAASAAAALGAVVTFLVDPLAPSATAAAAPPPLAPLLGQRRALASGQPLPAPAGELSREAFETARVFAAVDALARNDGARALGELAPLPDPSGIPLAELSRSYAAFLGKDGDAALRAFDAYQAAGPESDALYLDAADVLALADHEERAIWVREIAARHGSRLETAWYGFATRRMLDIWRKEAEEKGELSTKPDAEAEDAFAHGLRLRPLQRETLFDSPILWMYLASSKHWSALRLADRVEPVRPPSAPPTRPIDLPAEALASTCGDSLRFRIGGARLVVPGGADIAPAGSPAESADAEERGDEEEALASLSEALTSPPGPERLRDATYRRRVEKAAGALARSMRWEELDRLTSLAGTDPQSVSSALVHLRARALHHLGRSADEKDLLLAFALLQKDRSFRDPATLFRLAEAFVTDRQYDTAIQLMKRAMAQIPFEVSDARVRQIGLLKRLDEGSEVTETAHFTLRAPKSADPGATRHFGRILEAERTRLGAFIPLTERRFAVDLIDVQQFLSTFSIGDVEVVGLYDGRIRLPLANTHRFTPTIVSIATHELAHALLADATLDRAPKWFHEGLAQMLEMHESRANPILAYLEKDRLISVPVIEGVLESFPAPEVVGAAYESAAWTLLYVAAKTGPKGIRSMIESYRTGEPTDAAMTKALGREFSATDEDFLAWNRSHPVLEGKLVRYPDAPMRGIDLDAAVAMPSAR